MQQNITVSPPPAINIGTDTVDTSHDKANNLAVMLDNDSSLSQHITIVKTANFQLYHLSHIRKYLNPVALCIVAHLLISSGINLLQLPASWTSQDKLQHVMNCAPQLILGVGKCDHITTVMNSLYWLLGEYRIEFEVLCLAYKAPHIWAQFVWVTFWHATNLPWAYNPLGKIWQWFPWLGPIDMEPGLLHMQPQVFLMSFLPISTRPHLLTLSKADLKPIFFAIAYPCP